MRSDIKKNVSEYDQEVLTKACVMKRKKLELKAHKTPFKLRVFFRICKHHLQKLLILMIELYFLKS